MSEFYGEETSEEFETSDESETFTLTVEEKQCRICFEEETENNLLISPCLCNGTSKYVHRNCLERWREMNRGAVGFFKCMECHFRYNIFYKFPRETFKFEQINLFEKNIINLNFILYISSLYYGTADKLSGYKLIQIIDPNPYKNLQIVLKHNSLYSSFFYYSLSMSLYSLLFQMFIISMIPLKIFTQLRYWKKTIMFYIFNFIVSLHFIGSYYIFKLEQDGGFLNFLNFEICVSCCTLWMWKQLMIYHNSAIDSLNSENACHVIERPSSPPPI